MVHVCIILVDFGFRGLVVTYFDFWWSQRLFSEKAVGKRVVGSGSVTKLAIDQLKPRRSSLSATSVQCKQALHNTLQFTAFLHFPRDRPLHFLCTLSLCTALARQNAMHFSLCISHLILHCAHWALEFALWKLDIGHCTVHIGHCTLHCVGASEHRLIWRRPLRTEAMSRYRWEPQHLRNQCTMRQSIMQFAIESSTRRQCSL